MVFESYHVFVFQLHHSNLHEYYAYRSRISEENCININARIRIKILRKLDSRFALEHTCARTYSHSNTLALKHTRTQTHSHSNTGTLGDVSTKTYLTYLSSGGLPLVFVLILLFTVGQVAAIMSDVTLEEWSTKSESEQENPNLFYTFMALTLTATVAGFVRRNSILTKDSKLKLPQKNRYVQLFSSTSVFEHLPIYIPKL